MDFLHGEYECKLDGKGRLKMPSQLLRQLGGEDGGEVVLYLNRGFEKCLMMYPERVWQGMVVGVSKLNVYRKNERDFVRYFFRGLSRVVVDSAERILLSKPLQAYAGLVKEVVVFAYLDRIEIWDRRQYAKMIDEEPGEFGELAEQIFGSNDTIV